MKTLELYAKTYFEKYSMQEYGRLLSWHRIPKRRQLDWMEDIFSFFKYAIENTIDIINGKEDNVRHATSYELGYQEGVKAERRRNVAFLNSLLDTLYEELEEVREANDIRSESKN